MNKEWDKLEAPARTIAEEAASMYGRRIPVDLEQEIILFSVAVSLKRMADMYAMTLGIDPPK